MQKKQWQTALKNLPLGQQHYFAQVGSTNDIAAKLLDADAPHLSLVLADEQVKGRGRNGRSWTTTGGAALAFSVILLPKDDLITTQTLGRVSGLGGIAVCLALQKHYSLPAAVKWPNDVLLNGKKVAGVLAEAHWRADRLQGVVLGIGINVLPASVPPARDLNFPATSVAAEYGATVSRPELLAHVLTEVINWYSLLNSDNLLKTWEANLAFRGEQVYLDARDGTHVEGRVLGLNPDGSLRLGTGPGETHTFRIGEIRLRASINPPAS
ncbi:MAG: biotin--[acetyl-CoA-carboxylase] ligase [Anaerolineaceae bacterium 4572_5.1]|nr:MAG: biotin--[acetyl-CoA-carboxylase] ligase [Anaerolineaceae bacterium 4572_5.1]